MFPWKYSGTQKAICTNLRVQSSGFGYKNCQKRANRVFFASLMSHVKLKQLESLMSHVKLKHQ